MQVLWFPLYPKTKTKISQRCVLASVCFFNSLNKALSCVEGNEALNSAETNIWEQFLRSCWVFLRKKYCQQHWKEAACNFMLLQIVSCLAHTKSFNWGSDTPQENEPVMANTAHCREILFSILSSISHLDCNFLVPN